MLSTWVNCLETKLFTLCWFFFNFIFFIYFLFFSLNFLHFFQFVRNNAAFCVQRALEVPWKCLCMSFLASKLKHTHIYEYICRYTFVCLCEMYNWWSVRAAKLVAADSWNERIRGREAFGTSRKHWVMMPSAELIDLRSGN